MAFQGKFPLRSKIVINNHPIQQVSHFWYLGADVSYRKDNGTETKLQQYKNFHQINIGQWLQGNLNDSYFCDTKFNNMIV
jgi:hypothetical protein